MDNRMEKVKALLSNIKGNSQVNRDDPWTRNAVEQMYRRGMLVMAMDTGKLRLSSYGEEIMGKLGGVQ